MMQSGSPGIQPVRIVFVGDKRNERDRVHAFLAAEKRFEVHSVGTSEALQAKLAENRFDCVILDSMVGADSGFAINESIVSKQADPPSVIMLTDEGTEQMAIKAFRSGFADYIRMKPSVAPELAASIVRAASARLARLQQKAEAELLAGLAMRDRLTGLPNRNALEERMKTLYESGRRHKKSFAVIMIDINQFKSINDNFGHSIGDRALIAFARRMSRGSRGSDTCGRYAGDEFLYLIDQSVTVESVALACRRLVGVLSFSLELENIGLSLRPSIGAAIYPIDGVTVSDLLKEADRAMYIAKSSGSGYALALEHRNSRDDHAADIAATVHSLEAQRPLPFDPAADVAPAATAKSASPAHLDQNALVEVHRFGDRRREHRHRVLKRGLIAINNGFSTISCIVRNISAHGARLSIEADHIIPEDVVLQITESGRKFHAKKRWQKGKDIGLGFVGAAAPVLDKPDKPQEAAIPRAPVEVKAPARTAERYAFVVDDEPQVCALLSRVLARRGFATVELKRVSEVEAALSIVRPDAIDVMRSLTASRFTGKVLLISGHDAATIEDVRKIGERQGLTLLPTLRKPFRVEEFAVRLADVTPVADASTFAFETALRNNWLELWYQPKFELNTMAFCGAEALIRSRHPEQGILLPSTFLPPAGSHLYRPLTDFIVQRSLADWSSMSALAPAGSGWSVGRLSFNIPASILQTSAFVDNLLRQIPKQANFPGLTVEITEQEAFSDPERAREIAIQLRLHDILVSIDDFGAGNSNLARLSELPFAELKLDGSFVNGCAFDDRKHAMCRTVVDLALRNGMTTVAEGVETADDLSALRTMGFQMAQGFYLAEPMERDVFWQHLGNNFAGHVKELSSGHGVARQPKAVGIG
jgi:diguanylate cyclase (GGDEF)-like protein